MQSSYSDFILEIVKEEQVSVPENKSQKGNTTRMTEIEKGQENQNPEEDPRFHNMHKSLRRYRDATYSLKVEIHQWRHNL